MSGKFYKGHVTQARPLFEILFLHFGEIVHMHPHAKLQVSSFTGFGDMFEGVKFYKGHVTPSHAPLLNFYLSILEKLSTCSGTPNLKSVALLVLETYLRVCQIL